ncbi:MAG: hypothetical protein GY742_05845, partial [Hyphomicrobiales bacterium]|nr:hypothetical protein [Hyphomicrobiales bacterium]
TASTTYTLNYTKDGTPVASASITTDGSGNYLLSSLDAAAYTAINVTITNCTSNSLSATLNDPGTETIVLGTVSNPTTCSGTDGSIQITGLTASTTYTLNYTKDGTPVASASITTDGSGNYLLSSLDAAAYTAINVTLAGCTSNDLSQTLTDPSTPAIVLGTISNPTTCSGTD